jgi:hypothetical protein
VPRVEVVLFADEDGSVPLLAWLDAQSSKAKEKCIVRLERLSEMGHELRRPEADYLRDDIHELRVSHRRVQYRMLYFFSGRMAVVTHGLTKEGKVPEAEMNRATVRKLRFEKDPRRHTHRE